MVYNNHGKSKVDGGYKPTQNIVVPNNHDKN